MIYMGRLADWDNLGIINHADREVYLYLPPMAAFTFDVFMYGHIYLQSNLFIFSLISRQMNETGR